MKSPNRLHLSPKRTFYLILVAILPLIASACHGNISPETLRVCDRGEKTENGCKNPEHCNFDTHCIEGFYCNPSTNQCEIGRACSKEALSNPTKENEECGIGYCKEVKNDNQSIYACINPDRCIPNDPIHGCIPGQYCSDEGKCEIPVVQCGTECTDNHGICTVNGCQDPAHCDNDSQCLRGRICANDHTCVPDSKEACPTQDGGQCNPRTRKYEDVEPCNDNKQCLNGKHCETATGICKTNQCNTTQDCQSTSGGAAKIGGVCTQNICQNSTHCTDDNDCLNNHVCVYQDANTHICLPVGSECTPACTGKQTCEKNGHTYTCTNPTTCSTTIDCVKGTYCDTGICKTSDSTLCQHHLHATDFIYTTEEDVTLCSDDIDTIIFNRKMIGQESLVHVVIEVTGENIGKLAKDALSIEFKNKSNDAPIPPSGNLSQIEEKNAVYYTQSVQTNVDQIKVIVKSSDKNNQFGTGLTYKIKIIESPKETYTTCTNAPLLTTNATQDAEVNNDGTLYRIDVTKEQFYTISVKPKTGNKGDQPISLSILTDCLDPLHTLFAKTATSKQAPISFSEKLSPGTYYIKLSAGTTPSDVQIVWNSRDIECKQNEQTCSNDQTLRFCNDSYRIDTKTCTCANDKCEEEKGHGCLNAIEVNKGNISEFKQKLYSFSIPSQSFENRWKHIEDPSKECQKIASYSDYTDDIGIKDVTFHVTIPSGYLFNANVSAGGGGYSDFAIFVMDDTGSCDQETCLKAINQDTTGSNPETYQYVNETNVDKKLYVVVKNHSLSSTRKSFQDLVVQLELKKYLCVPNRTECNKKRELRICDSTGEKFSAVQVCNPAGLGCVNATTTEPAHCDIPNDTGDTCDKAIPLTSGTPLQNQNFRYNNDSNRYDAYIQACKDLGLNGGKPFEYSNDNVYKINVKNGDRVRIHVTPENQSFDPLIWVAKEACNVAKPATTDLTCLTASNTYSYQPYSLGKPEVIEFQSERDGDYYIFVTNQDASKIPDASKALYTISAEVSSTTACSPATDTGVCKNNQITFCSDLGFKDSVHCKDGCTDDNKWCNTPSSEPLLEGVLCQYPTVVPTSTKKSGNLFGDIPGDPTTNKKTDYYHGQSIPMSTDKNIDYKGDCLLPKANSTYGDIPTERHIYAFSLAQGETLSVTKLYMQNKNGSIYLTDNCYAPTMCKSLLDAKTSGEIQYLAEKAKTIYLIVTGSGAHGLQWSIKKGEDKCSVIDSYCDASNTSEIHQCLGGGPGEITLACPQIASSQTLCKHGLCDLSDIDFTSNSCKTPINIGKGSSFIYDPTNVTATAGSSSLKTCSQTLATQSTKKTYYRLTGLTPGDIIHAQIDRLDPNYMYGLYITDTTNCDTTLADSDPLDKTCDIQASSSTQTPKTTYVVTNETSANVVLVAENSTFTKPVKVNIYVEPAANKCTVNGKLECHTATPSAYLRECIDGEWQRLFSCSGACSSSDACSLNDITGDTPESAITLSVPDSKPHTWQGTLEAMSDTTYKLPHDGNTYGACIISYGYQKSPGPDKYFKIHLNKDDILKASVNSTQIKTLSLYLLDEDRKTCIAYAPTTNESAPSELLFSSNESKDYILVIDSQINSTKQPNYVDDDITLTYQVSQDTTIIPPNTFLHQCIGPKQLATWSNHEDISSSTPTPTATWEKNVVTCPDTCSRGVCIAGKNTDTPTLADNHLLTLPFVTTVDFNKTTSSLKPSITIPTTCFKSNPPASLKPEIDAYWKVSLKAHEKLEVYQLLTKKDYYGYPYYFVFKDINDPAGTCAFAAYTSKNQLASFYPISPVNELYQAGNTDETIYIGISYTNKYYSAEIQATFFIDSIKP